MGRQRILGRTAAALAALLATTQIAEAARCADYSTCREAVTAWCAGAHSRADGDDDGIPCENVCGTLSEVQAIMAEIGCTR